jgi:hypothetical protein
VHAKSHRFSLLPSNLLLCHLLLAAQHPILAQWLMKLTRPFTSPAKLLSTWPRLLLEGRATSRRLPPPPMRLLRRWQPRPPPCYLTTGRSQRSLRRIALPITSPGWLAGGLESFIPEVDVSMTDNSTVVCFESHLIAGFGLPPSKFLIAILNFLGCELVHLNLNAIAVLSCFTMLCEC